jgi:hypothetical protein
LTSYKGNAKIASNSRAIPEETVKDVNARITNDKGTASENNIVNKDDKRSNNLNDNDVSVRTGGSRSSGSLLCKQRKTQNLQLTSINTSM